VVVVIKFFADASGKSDQAAFVTAGYAGTETQWEAFEAEWAAALTGAGVQMFHATDFFNFRGEFTGWDADPKQHRHFAKTFTAIAEGRTDVAIARGVDIEAYERVIAPAGFAKHRPQGRFPAMIFCASTMLYEIAIAPRYKDRLFEVVFEEEAGASDLIAYLDWCKRRGETWLARFARIGIGAKRVLPLQAADLIAHELWRHLREMLHPTGRPQRKTLTRLSRRNRVEFKVATELELTQIVPKVLAFQRERGMI
jgi:hypothetical protein